MYSNCGVFTKSTLYIINSAMFLLTPLQFQQMEMEGLYVKENEIHRQCFSVVFRPLVESSLNEFLHYWNSHAIRQSRQDCIAGRPDDLYDMPSYYGTCIFWYFLYILNCMLCT